MPGKRARRHFSQLSELERCLIIGMKTAGWSTRRVVGQVDRSECAVRNCWEQWTREGTHRGTDNCVRVWKRPGERYNSPRTVLRHTAHTAGVMVWEAIAYDSRSTLIVMHGTLTGQRYVDDILRPHVGPILNGLSEAILQQDNVRPHTARVAQDFLRHFQTLPWPARSPDLSLVEHVWDQLKRQMHRVTLYMI
ncbi:transposable element Tc1 transposase [Trichonephila clavipes]|nr:transposable element Tc1 transposase [Trichonephila clavipes]